MRHQKQNVKLGRSPSHRKALLSSLVCNLIKRRRVTTTVQKAKLARIEAEKLVTLARKGTLHARRLVASRLRQPDAVSLLFSDIVPLCEGRPGGYTRILKLGRRRSDGAEMAILEWVGSVVVATEETTEDSE